MSDWKVYLRWHLVHASAAFLPDAFVKENFNFYGSVLSGQPQQEPRWKRSAHMIDGTIGDEMLKKLSDHATAGLIGLCWMNGGTRNVYNSKHPVKSVADLKGLKIATAARGTGNAATLNFALKLGGLTFKDADIVNLLRILAYFQQD